MVFLLFQSPLEITFHFIKRDYLCGMNQYGTAAYYTLGCKLNFSETSTIARSLEDAGYAKVPFDEVANVYVINTCSVTENADKKCRNIVRKAKNTNPMQRWW